MDDADTPRASEPERVVRARRRAPGLILHVEDNHEVRLATCTLLRVAGFETREASSADEALAQVDSLRNRLDVLIVDYHLGGEMTGTEVVESFARQYGHGVPTVILTGDPANAEVPWIKNSPVWLVSKPVCAVTLIAGLHSLVSFRRAMQRISNR